MFADLLTPETFEFFALYVLSGFVIIIVANAFVVGRKPRPSEALLEIILYSLFNQLVWLVASSAAAWVSSRAAVDLWHPSDQAQFYLQVLGLPVVIGWILGLGTKRRWLTPALRALSLPIVDPYPRAYDHVFAEFEGQALLIIAFADGKNIYGRYGYASRASRDPSHSEVYLEELYEVDAAGKWAPASPSRSALVKLEGLRAIEIIPIADD